MSDELQGTKVCQVKVSIKIGDYRATPMVLVVVAPDCDSPARIKKKLKERLEAAYAASNFPDVKITMKELRTIKSDAFFVV